MTPKKMQFATIRYNPAFGAFETRVAIEEDGVTYVYPVHAAAPLTGGFHLITNRLVQKARDMHAKRSRTMHLRKPASSDHTDMSRDRAA